MSNYTKQISWSGKDALSDSDPEKVISGGDFDTEFSAVQTAINSKIDGGTITNFTSTGIDDNATSTAITIDASEKILIGDVVSHTTDLLQIETPASGGGHGIQIRRNDSNDDQTVGHILFGNNSATDLASISAKTNGDVDSGVMLFNTSATAGANTERLRIDSDGIKFNGDTAAANALDDYETGTWTPAFSAATGTITTNTANSWGNYTKIGNTVHWIAQVRVLSVSSPSGALAITGLPFTSGSASGSSTYHSGWIETSFTGTPTIDISTSSTLINLRRMNNGVVTNDLAGSMTVVGSYVFTSGTYQTS